MVGEAMDLMLLLQNVSNKRVDIPSIWLMPTIANGESHPYGDSAWAIFARWSALGVHRPRSMACNLVRSTPLRSARLSKETPFC